MIDDRARVAIIDSDDSSRERLRVLLEAAGFMVELLASAEAYLETNRTSPPNCIVLDERLPGRSGLDLQAELAKATWQAPLVFITTQNDVPTSVQAMKAGAIDYLTKPFQNQEALDAVRTGIAGDYARRAEEQALRKLKICFRSLTPRERQTIALISAGRSVKQIAGEMGVCTHTARIHSNRVMLKMGARSIASLIRMVDKLGHASRKTEVHSRFDIENNCPTDCIRAVARPSNGDKRVDHPSMAGRANLLGLSLHHPEVNTSSPSGGRLATAAVRKKNEPLRGCRRPRSPVQRLP
jgi:FixJ family two-component response regulator